MCIFLTSYTKNKISFNYMHSFNTSAEKTQTEKIINLDKNLNLMEDSQVRILLHPMESQSAPLPTYCEEVILYALLSMYVLPL